MVRESKQPVVLLHAELPRVDRTLLGMLAARRLVVVSQRGRRVLAAALGGEHADPAAVAIAAGSELAGAGARVALHLEALRVASGASGTTVHGDAIDKPESWLPAGTWTGVVLSRALASVIQAPTRDADGQPGFCVLAGKAQRVELFGREALLTDLASDAVAALLRAPATGPGVVSHGAAQAVARDRVGGPGFALVVGEAGIGKSAFASELATRLRELDVTVHLGTVPPPGGGKPSSSALGELVRPETRSGPGARVRELGDALRGAARARPLAVILDDLHLADHELLDALEYATLGGEVLPLWVLGVASPRIDVRRPDLGARAERHRRDVLGPLDEDAAIALAARLLEPAEYPPLRALRRLAGLAHGNPLHLATLAHEIHARGAIRIRAGGSHFFDTSALDELAPAALGPWLAARELAGLAPELVALARICAVVAGDGVELERDEISAIVDGVERAGGATTPVDVGVGLRELETTGLLVTSPRGFQFRQALVEEGIYATTEEGERLAIHRAALALWRRGVDGGGAMGIEAAERLARHAEAVGELALAARAFAVRAREAHVRHLLLDEDQAWQGALRNLPAHDEPRARALLGRAEARARQQRTHQAVDDAEAALAIARELGARELELEARFVLAHVLDLGDDFPRSKDVAEQALAMLGDTPVGPHVQRAALLAAARILFRAQRFAEAVPGLREVVRVAREAGDYDVEIAGALILGPALVELRELDEAERLFDEVDRDVRASRRSVPSGRGLRQPRLAVVGAGTDRALGRRRRAADPDGTRGRPCDARARRHVQPGGGPVVARRARRGAAARAP